MSLPAAEGSHGNAAVLELGVAHESEGGRRAKVSETERVPDGHAGLLRLTLHVVSSTHAHGRGRATHRRKRRLEGGRAGAEENKGGGRHCNLGRGKTEQTEVLKQRSPTGMQPGAAPSAPLRWLLIW